MANWITFRKPASLLYSSLYMMQRSKCKHKGTHFCVYPKTKREIGGYQSIAATLHSVENDETAIMCER